MRTVLVILTDGFEEIEAVAPIDLLRRAGARVTLASCTDSLEVTGKCAVVMKAEVFLDDCLANDYDLPENSEKMRYGNGRWCKTYLQTFIFRMQNV